MTILPKKKHPDGKKNEPNNPNDLRHSRSRNNCARTSGERANRSAEDINESAVYRSGNLELRATSESSSNGKRRYRNSNNDYRRRDEAGYNSEDEYDVCNSNEQPTEEVKTSPARVLICEVSLGNFPWFLSRDCLLSMVVTDFVSSFKVEKQFEKILKEKKGFVIKKTAEDGACLFRAVGRVAKRNHLV